MPQVTWMAPEERLVFELRQLREEGLDPGDIERDWLNLAPMPGSKAARSLALKLLDACAHLAQSRRSSDRGPLDDLPGPNPSEFDEETLYEKVLGGWSGRMAGCLLGKPVEKASREGIQAILESIGEWPLRTYFTAVGVPRAVSDRYPWNRGSRLNSLRENIDGMPEDDDINFPMLNLQVLEKHGRAFTTEDIATTWLQMLPALRVFTAERVAYHNLLSGMSPPDTAQHHNPYREWIGAQIRGSIWGWVNPGDVVGAAEFAWRDARLSHTANGVYAAMFAAALVASAFSAIDVDEVVSQARVVVPKDSRLSEAIGYSIELCRSETEWENILDALHARYGKYHWAHAINNTALVVAALLHGSGNFDESITSVVMGGWDTDSNGASVGSVVGTLGGVDVISRDWLEPIGNRVKTSLMGFDGTTIAELAERTTKLVEFQFQDSDVERSASQSSTGI